METIEQLKQDNAKLQERLNNAAKFFREQKAQIENLTKENDELKHDAESFNSLQESYENNIKSKDQAYKLLQDTYNEVFAENKKLSEEIKKQDSYQEEIISLKDQLVKSNEDLQKRIEQIRAIEKTYDEEQKKIIEARDEWMKKYKELEGKFKENDIVKGEAELRLECIQTEYTKKFEEQDGIIESLKKENKEIEEQYNKVLSSYEKDLKDKNEQIEKNVNVCEDLMHDFKVEEEKHKKDIELKEKFAEDCDELNKSNVELKDKVDKLNKLYDDCENEKLAIQADYETLKEQYNELKINADAYEEAAREYEDIYEDYEKYKNFINALFRKAEELNITWNKPEDQPKNDEVKKENKKDNDNSSKVTVEYAKKTTSNSDKGRVINQEMNVPGYTINI